MNSRLLLLVPLAASTLFAQVSFDRILGANKEPQNWLTYSGTTFSQRYSLLNQVTPANVKNLELQWVYQVRSLEKFEATPLVVDGIMYTVEAPNTIIALDAASGRVFWKYTYAPSADARPCCGRVNRGVAIAGDTLFMGTIDAHLIAVDAKSGKLLWDKSIAPPKSGYALTLAPLIVKDKVIVGTAGGELGVRGFLAAYDTRTGKELWRFYTIPGPGEPGHETWQNDAWKTGGGPIWVTGSYDPDSNLTYWGVGNAGPDYNGDVRPGDNLYTSSVIALDADTGKLKWHYQFSPHDQYDYDAVQIPVLADLQWQGKPRKVMLWAFRGGLFYVLDRTNGQFLLGKPFVEVNWMNGFDEDGRPKLVAGKLPSAEGVRITPGNQGGTNWYSPAYSPRTGLFYISSWVNYTTSFSKGEGEYSEGKFYTGGGGRRNNPNVVTPAFLTGANTLNVRKEEEGYGAIRAMDLQTGERKWEYKMSDVTDAGILTTATDLLFSGGRDGYFYALDARTGTLLWKASVGGYVANGPMTYSVNGRQYVAVAAGNSLFVYALRQ